MVRGRGQVHASVGLPDPVHEGVRPRLRRRRQDLRQLVRGRGGRRQVRRRRVHVRSTRPFLR